MNTLFKFETPLNADSVEWCPHEPFKNLFVCANYNLVDTEEDTTQKRIGKILLFSITSEKGLHLMQSLDTAAVFDQKWCLNRITGDILLGVANADSKLEIYRLNETLLELELITFYQISVDCSNLLLSLDWSNGKQSSQTPDIVCSDSKGNWHKFNLLNGGLKLECSSAAHEFEAWIAAFYYWDPRIIFTGGDDAQLKKFDTRIGLEAVAKNRSFDAGVTCLHSNAQNEFILASGSYDEHLRIWDIRNMKLPVSKEKMPGPMWRVKWDPFSFKFILAACMLGGAHVIEVTENKLAIVASYDVHKSITYGTDWSYLDTEQVSKFDATGNRIVGTCSFYDNLLCISKMTLEE